MMSSVGGCSGSELRATSKPSLAIVAMFKYRLTSRIFVRVFFLRVRYPALNVLDFVSGLGTLL